MVNDSRHLHLKILCHSLFLAFQKNANITCEIVRLHVLSVGTECM